MGVAEVLDEYDRSRGTTPEEHAARAARVAAFHALCDEDDANEYRA